MMSEIKQLAGKVSEDYLLRKVAMTPAISKIAAEKKLNPEYVKRLCELANQNTYLTIFNGSKEGRGNISFDVADSEKAIQGAKETDMSMHEYEKAPDDFRLSDEYDAEQAAEEAAVQEEAPKSLEHHLRHLHEKIRFNDRLKHLLDTIKTMKAQEERGAEDSVMKVSSYCKSLILSDESVMDMAKLSMRYSKDRGYDLNKTAALFETVMGYMDGKGLTYNKELTKVSSMKIDPSHEVFKMIEDYNQHIVKLSGLYEMEANLEAVHNGIRKLS